MTSNQLIIAIWAAFVILAGVVLGSTLRIDDDLTVFLPSDGSAVEDLLFTRLREGPAARLILVALEGGSPEDRQAASKAAAAELSTWDRLVSVNNGEQAITPVSFGSLFDYRYLLSKETFFGSDDLEAALAIRQRQLASPFGKVFEKEATNDPTGQFHELLVSWRDGTKPPPREGGVWVSPDSSRALLLLETTNPGYTLDHQAETVAVLETELGAIAANYGVELMMAGTPISTVLARNSVAREMIIGTALALTIILGFLYWVYRSFRVLALGALPIATGILLGMVVTVLVFGSIHRITMAFGITLLGVAIDYPLHLFSHTHKHELLRATATRILPPMLLGALTTVAAFIVLGTGGFAGLVQLAVFIGTGLVAAVVTALWLLPSIAGDQRLFAGAMPLAGRVWAPPGWLTPVFVGFSIVAIVLLMSRGDAIWERDLSAISPVPQSAKRLDGTLRADLGAPDLRYLFMISGETTEAMLQRSELLEPSLIELRESGAIGSFDAIHRYMPSQARQLERRERLPSRAVLDADLKAILDEMGLDPSLFSPFQESVDASRSLPPLTLDQGLQIFKDTPLWPKLLNLIAERDDRWFGFVPLSAVQDLAALKATGDRNDDVDFIDLKEISSGSIESFRNQALIRLFIGMAVILVLLLAVRREVMVSARILLAMISALAVTAGALFLLGEKFSLFHILASLVVIGIGLDYGLFFSWKSDLIEERRRAFHGIAICAVSTTIVFALLAMSSISVLRIIGLTVALGTCFTFVSCYLLVALPSQKNA
ncbi:MAG: MMPL family transporter [Geminicoccales bacterium]